MGTEDEKGFKFDIPIVADRREFFEQEAVVSGPPGVLKSIWSRTRSLGA